MSTITKERVKDILEFGAGRIISPITDDEIMELARIALASLEAEPVAYMVGTALLENMTQAIAYKADMDLKIKPPFTAQSAPELKIAHLINKFYERYPLAEFKSDAERSTALGYFMAGAELQCFGEFINYAELMGDE
ncbi:hypothetical protein OLZ31_06460 [Enterobacter asburiae]|nr:hypothetical protein [Enterobacter asburiae]